MCVWDSLPYGRPMSDVKTMVQTEVSVNGSRFLLAEGQDIDELKRRFEKATATTGTFVEFVAVGQRSVSVLVSSGTTVVFAVETVSFDPRDDDHHHTAFGDMFDM